MTLEELKNHSPLSVERCKLVEEINAVLSLRRDTLSRDFTFWSHLAAHRGGIYNKTRGKFEGHYEYDPVSRTLKPARIRIPEDPKGFIGERNIIKSKGKEYYRSWWMDTIEKQLKQEGKL